MAHLLGLHQHCLGVVSRYDGGFHVIVALVGPAFKYVEGQLHYYVAAGGVYVRSLKHSVAHQSDAALIAGQGVDAYETYLFLQSAAFCGKPRAVCHAVVLPEYIVGHDAFGEHSPGRLDAALLQPVAAFNGKQAYAGVFLQGRYEAAVALDCGRRAFKSADFGHSATAS